MRRIVILTAFVAALVAAAPAAATALRPSCGPGCATLYANGTGTLGVTGSGDEWGGISSGTIWVRDRTGAGHAKNWVHGTALNWSWIGDGGWKVTSKKAMTFSATTKFWLKLKGPGIYVSGVHDGSGTIAGTGKYTLNGHAHSWPQTAKALSF